MHLMNVISVPEEIIYRFTTLIYRCVAENFSKIFYCEINQCKMHLTGRTLEIKLATRYIFSLTIRLRAVQNWYFEPVSNVKLPLTLKISCEGGFPCIA